MLRCDPVRLVRPLLEHRQRQPARTAAIDPQRANVVQAVEEPGHVLHGRRLRRVAEPAQPGELAGRAGIKKRVEPGERGVIKARGQRLQREALGALACAPDPRPRGRWAAEGAPPVAAAPRPGCRRTGLAERSSGPLRSGTTPLGGPPPDRTSCSRPPAWDSAKCVRRWRCDGRSPRKPRWAPRAGGRRTRRRDRAGPRPRPERGQGGEGRGGQARSRAVGVAASGHDVGQLVGTERVEASDLPLIVGRLHVASPQIVAQQPFLPEQERKEVKRARARAA